MTGEKKELLDSTFHKFMDIGFGQRNLHLLNEIVAKDVVGFGTAIDERLFGIAQLEELLTRQKQQSAGLEMKWEVTTLDLHISSDENTAVFTNEVTLQISNDRDPIKMYLRFSVVLEFEQHKWVVVHWHGSKPEQVESEKDTWGLDLWKAKADELEKLVAERTAELLVKNRELEVEAALERVRARTMAMEKSEELGEVATVLFRELNSLVDDLWTCGFVFCEENRQEDEWWLSLANGLIQPFFLPNVGDFTHEALYKGWENGEAYRTVTLENEMLKEHYDWLMNIPIARQIFDEMEGSGIPRPNWQRLHAAYFKTGYLVVITEIPCKEEEIFERFAQVFDLTYTRFLDLQKAEAQAREARIEAALEKVRSRSLAMHKADELLQVATVMRAEMAALGVEELETSSIYTMLDPETAECWYAIKDVRGQNSSLVFDEMTINLNATFVGRQMLEFFKSAAPQTSILMIGEQRKEWINYCASCSSLLKGYYGDEIPERTYHLVKFSHGYVGAATPGAISTESWSLLHRMTAVFSLAYTRFLDLQKAEAQARESQIQLALERVRAKTMAMQKSDELPEAANLLFQQVQSLGMPAWSAGYCTWNDDEKKSVTLWMSSEGVLQPPFSAPTTVDQLFIQMRVGAEEGKDLHVVDLGGEELEQHYRYMRVLPVVGEILDSIIEAGHPLPTFQIMHQAYFSKGFLLFITYEPVPESHDIFKRFAIVFDQTYTRFLDLQKAEEQAREAQIQLGLERVRARTMAMQKQQDLFDVVNAFGEQLVALGLRVDYVSFINGTISKDRDWDLWGCNPNLKLPADHNFIPYKNTAYFTKTAESVDRYERTGYPIQVKTFNREEKDEFFDHYFSYAAPVPQEFKQFLYDAPGSTIVDAFLGEVTVSLCRYDLEPFTQEQLEIFKRFSIEFRQAYIRFLDLQKAEAQAREAQIEAALERVRSRSMAMHKSEELKEVIQLMFEQFRLLNFNIDSAQFDPNFKENDDLNLWAAAPGQPYSILLNIPYFDNPLFNSIKEAKNKGLSFISQQLSYEEKNQFFRHFFQHIKSIPAERQKLIFDSPGMYRAVVFMDNVSLAIQNYSNIPYTEEENEVLKRFGKTFEQVYTRFLDLQKAEAQAREAQIEAALERVRSKAMAMHNSSDLPSTAIIAFSELKKLGFVPIRGGISIQNKENRKNLLYSATSSDKADNLSVVGWATLDNHPILSEIYNQWLLGNDYYPSMKGKVLQAYYKQIQPTFNIPLQFPDEEQFGYFMHFTHGTFYGWCKQAVTVEEKKLLKRFAAVVDLTFKRYFDLQKAEEQAKEAKIEAALERVRAKAMAMHSSNELREVVHELRKQMGILGQKNLETCVIHLHDESHEYIQSWAGIKPPDEEGDILESIANVPKRGLSIIEEALDAYNSNLQDYVLLNEGEKLRQWFSFLEKEAPEGFAKLVDSVHGNIEELRSYWSFADFAGGSLLMVTRDGPDELTRGLLRRFSNVFGLAYRRFADLKNAEAQAREAKIEAALEKVRSRTMAMQSSEELADAAYVLFEQLKALGVTHERINIGIVNEDSQTIDFWITEQGGDKLNTKFSGRISEPTTLSKAYTAWKNGEKSLMIDLQGDALESWLSYLNDEIKIPFNKAFLHDRRVQTAGFFSKGMLILTSPEPLQQEALYLLEKFAGVFDLTYTRFSDLKLAEAQALQAEKDLIEIKIARQKAEEALAELKATQVQLIQQEKLASLGQLTAGIAHEIKNPLNFVNNFSEVSIEMIGEVIDSRLKTQDTRPKTEADEIEDEILEDIKANLEKIHEHGSRANSIVTSMLQHSRGGSGKKEPTDLNALIKEYVNLSFHGMRAGKNPINVEIALDLDDTIKEIPLVREDFTRVIINLCNNAFDAMRGKTNSEFIIHNSEFYHPKLTVRTKSEKDHILISVEDNGPGIPDEIKDKILQPFFTTKKGTEGTGLGLSITHDIVKAHGGELKILTKVGEGTDFQILLPLNQTEK